MRIAISQSTGQPIPTEISNSIVLKRTHSIYKTIHYKKYFTCPLYFKLRIHKIYFAKGLNKTVSKHLSLLWQKLSEYFVIPL